MICVIYFVFLFFNRYGAHRDLHVRKHSFPTRRSSDLISFWDERHGKSFAGTVKTSGPNVKIDKMMIRWIEGKRVITATKRLNAFAGRRCSAPGFRQQEFIGYTSWNFASFFSQSLGEHGA